MTGEQAIQEITDKLIEFYEPVRIYLFGSVAPARRDLPAIPAVGFGKDIIPWRRTDFDQRTQWVKASLPARVVWEGKILYDAA